MHVVDGEIKWVETDNTGLIEFNHSHQVRACLRGRSMRRRVYNPDRLKYPLKRVGKRGEGKFKRISWDEALDTIADSLKHTIKEYGNDAIYLNYGTGTLGGTVTKSWDPSATLVARLMNLSGGYLNHYGDYSAAAIECKNVCPTLALSGELQDTGLRAQVNDTCLTFMVPAMLAKHLVQLKHCNGKIPQAP